MEKDFDKLFEFNEWANNKLVSSLKNQNITDENVLRLLSHLIISEQVWLQRLAGTESKGKNIWQVLTLSECETIMFENQKKFKVLIDQTDLSGNIIYKNSKGIEYTNSTSDILIHVLFHATYHRGQIAKEVRMLNKVPVLTDYIAFIREKSV